jgi:uncharacterized membrane protein (GlpM family)
MPSERKLNVSLSMKIKGESTSVKVLPLDPFAKNSIVGMDPMATHCRRLIVTGICQVKSYMSYLQRCTKIIEKLTLKIKGVD